MRAPRGALLAHLPSAAPGPSLLQRAGTVHAVRPTAEMLADCEPTPALDALLSEPEATGAYDRLPVQVGLFLRLGVLSCGCAFFGPLSRPQDACCCGVATDCMRGLLARAR